MKDLKNLLAVVVVLFITTIMCSPIYAANAMLEIPDWIHRAADVLQMLPFVGSYAVLGLKYLGLVAVLCTLLTGFLHGLASALQGMAWASGFEAFAAKVDAVYQMILPWVKFLSTYKAPPQLPPRRTALSMKQALRPKKK